MILAWTLILSWLALIGFAGFVLMGIDKGRARGRERRVPEMTLYKLALLGGALGVLAGAFIFHHKTSKPTFFGVVLILAVLWVVALAGLQRALGSPFA